MPFQRSTAFFALTLSCLAFAGPAPKAPAAKPAAQASASAPAVAPAAADAAPIEATDSTIVFLGKSGSRYHMKGCRYLKGAGKEITIGNAMKQGFAPCNACKAPRVKR